MDNNINFKGAFILKQPKPFIKKAVLKEAVSGKYKQVFENFTPDGDMLLITRKGLDTKVAEFLTHHRTKYEVYPNLSTKSGFDNELYDEAKVILDNNKSQILKTRDELIKFFKLKEFKPLFSTKRKKNPIENSLKALGFNTEKQTIKQRNGYSEVMSKDGKLLARISGPGQYGISFAFVEPKNMDESPLRYALRGGEIIFQYTSESGRVQFLKNYNRAVKANKVMPQPQTIRTEAHQ